MTDDTGLFIVQYVYTYGQGEAYYSIFTYGQGEAYYKPPEVDLASFTTQSPLKTFPRNRL
jgi:hypothetical protein